MNINTKFTLQPQFYDDTLKAIACFFKQAINTVLIISKADEYLGIVATNLNNKYYSNMMLLNEAEKTQPNFTIVVPTLNVQNINNELVLFINTSYDDNMLSEIAKKAVYFEGLAAFTKLNEAEPLSVAQITHLNDVFTRIEKYDKLNTHEKPVAHMTCIDKDAIIYSDGKVLWYHKHNISNMPERMLIAPDYLAILSKLDVNKSIGIEYFKKEKSATYSNDIYAAKLYYDNAIFVETHEIDFYFPYKKHIALLNTKSPEYIILDLKKDNIPAILKLLNTIAVQNVKPDTTPDDTDIHLMARDTVLSLYGDNLKGSRINGIVAQAGNFVKAIKVCYDSLQNLLTYKDAVDLKVMLTGYVNPLVCVNPDETEIHVTMPSKRMC